MSLNSQSLTTKAPDLKDYRTKGYQLFRNIIPKAVTGKLHEFLYKEISTLLALLVDFDISPDPKIAGNQIRALLTSPSVDAIDYNTRVLMTGHFPTDFRLSETFWDIARCAALRNLLSEIFESDQLFMHMPPMARFILPGNSEAGVPPHQDISYNLHMTDFVTVWIPLTQIDATSGGVRIYDGLKEGAIQHSQKVNNGVWIEGLPIEGLRPIDCTPMQPGDVLIFNPYIIHSSIPNISDRIRLSVDCRFFSDRARSNNYKLDMSEWKVIAPERD